MNRQKVILISEKIIEYSFYGLIFFLPISKALIETFACLAIFGFALNKIMTRDFKSFKDNSVVLWLLLILFMCNALSLINSGPFLLKSIRALFCKWGEYFLLFIIAFDYFKSQKSIKKFLYLFVFSGVLLGLSALSQKFLGVEIFRGRNLVGAAVTGSFENPNCLGAYLVCCFPVFISLVQRKRQEGVGTPIIFFLCAILLSSLLLTFSRGGWLGFFVGLLMMTILSRKKKLPASILALFFSSLFLFPPFVKRVVFSFAPLGDSQRYAIWQGAIDMIRENPLLGKGLGTFMNYFEKYVSGVEGVHYAHNCYLQIWAESGIFTLIAFLSLVGFIVYRGIRISLKNQGDDFGVFLSGLTAGLFGFLVASFFDTELYSLQLSVLFWVMLGMMVAVQRILINNAKS